MSQRIHHLLQEQKLPNTHALWSKVDHMQLYLFLGLSLGHLIIGHECLCNYGDFVLTPFDKVGAVSSTNF